MLHRPAHARPARLALAIAIASASLSLATTAKAEEETAPPSAFTVSGSAAIVSDYRLRGVSQSNNGFAIQAGVTVAHQSGFYAGAWGSNLAGWGTFGGPNLEVDLIGGYKKTVGPATIDAGLTWYMYPGGANKTDYAELSSRFRPRSARSRCSAAWPMPPSSRPWASGTIRAPRPPRASMTTPAPRWTTSICGAT
jgi:uncharacterized protein (TIGR02001 family)